MGGVGVDVSGPLVMGVRMGLWMRWMAGVGGVAWVRGWVRMWVGRLSLLLPWPVLPLTCTTMTTSMAASSRCSGICELGAAKRAGAPA